MFDSGENRVTLVNFRAKFEGVATEYFRFELDQLVLLIDLLQVLAFSSYNL